MLVDSRKVEDNTSKEGFNPNVQNTETPAVCSGGGKFAFIFLSIITIGLFPLFYWLPKSNWFNKMQIKTNEAASNIDVQLKKRRDTLVKLVDTLSSSAKFEKGLLTDVTKLRGTNNFNPSTAEGQANRSALDRLFANVEAYPQVQTTAAFRDMMSSADYIEREIAASRRVYNAVVTEFNQELYAWPASFVAASKKLYNLPLFAASAEDKKDVSLKIDL